MLNIKRIAVFGFILGNLFSIIHPVGVKAGERDSRTLKIGYRQDAAPFSYVDENGDIKGYSIEICRAIYDNLKEAKIVEKVDYIPVSSGGRFDDLHHKKIDLLCGATTVTIRRMREFRPTLFTFISGASFMYDLSNGSIRCNEFLSKKIGCLEGTTTESELIDIISDQCESLDDKNITSEEIDLIRLSSHKDSIDALKNGEIDIYYADRDILLYFRRKAQADNLDFFVSRRYFTNEPYALFTRGDDHELNFIANQTIVELCKSDKILSIFRNNFVGYLMSRPLQNLFQTLKLLDGADPKITPSPRPTNPPPDEENDIDSPAQTTI